MSCARRRRLRSPCSLRCRLLILNIARRARATATDRARGRCGRRCGRQWRRVRLWWRGRSLPRQRSRALPGRGQRRWRWRARWRQLLVPGWRRRDEPRRRRRRGEHIVTASGATTRRHAARDAVRTLAVQVATRRCGGGRGRAGRRRARRCAAAAVVARSLLGRRRRRDLGRGLCRPRWLRPGAAAMPRAAVGGVGSGGGGLRTTAALGAAATLRGHATRGRASIHGRAARARARTARLVTGVGTASTIGDLPTRLARGDDRRSECLSRSQC